MEHLNSGKILPASLPFFEAPFPARSAFGASGLALGGRVEIECIATVNQPA